MRYKIGQSACRVCGRPSTRCETKTAIVARAETQKVLDIDVFASNRDVPSLSSATLAGSITNCPARELQGAYRIMFQINDFTPRIQLIFRLARLASSSSSDQSTILHMPFLTQGCARSNPPRTSRVPRRTDRPPPSSQAMPNVSAF